MKKRFDCEFPIMSDKLFRSIALKFEHLFQMSVSHVFRIHFDTSSVLALDIDNEHVISY